MPTAVRDASLVTIKNRNIALNNYYNDWKTNTMSAVRPSQALTTPGFTGAETLVQAKDGCVQCTVLSNIALNTLNGAADRNLLPLANQSRGGAPASTTTS